MKRLRIATLLEAKASRERDLVVAMIAARVLDPQSKLATSRSWHHSTLGEWFGAKRALFRSSMRLSPMKLCFRWRRTGEHGCTPH